MNPVSEFAGQVNIRRSCSCESLVPDYRVAHWNRMVVANQSFILAFEAAYSYRDCIICNHYSDCHVQMSGGKSHYTRGYNIMSSAPKPLDWNNTWNNRVFHVGPICKQCLESLVGHPLAPQFCSRRLQEHHNAGNRLDSQGRA